MSPHNSAVACADTRRSLPLLDHSVDCVLTSVPYFDLRCYGTSGQLGQEDTRADFLEEMVAACQDLRRVLKPWGTCWLEIGDTRITDGRGEHRANEEERLKLYDLAEVPGLLAEALRFDGWFLRDRIVLRRQCPAPETTCGWEWRLEADGQRMVRGAWRTTSSYTTLLLLTPSREYFCDAYAAREPASGGAKSRGQGRSGKATRVRGRKSGVRFNDEWVVNLSGAVMSRNLRSVWDLPSQPQSHAKYGLYSGLAENPPTLIEHHAVFPEWLPRRVIQIATSDKGNCAKCGMPWVRVLSRQRFNSRTGEPVIGSYSDGSERRRTTAKGRATSNITDWQHHGWRPSCQCDNDRDPIPALVLDPFGGSGTTAVVARELGRRAVSLDLSLRYCRLAMARVREVRHQLPLDLVAPPLAPPTEASEQLVFSLEDAK